MSGGAVMRAAEDLARAEDFRVGEMEAGAAAEWDSFVLAHPEATFFHRAGWKRVIEEGFGHRCYLLEARQGGRIAGVLPLVHVRSPLFGKALIAGGFAVYGGPLASGATAYAALDREALALAERLDVDHLEYRSRVARHAEWAIKDDLYCTFRREIFAEPEKNLTLIPRKQRAVVRQSLKHGLTARINEDPDPAWRLYAESVRNLGTPVYARKYFRLLKEEFGTECEALVIEAEGKAVASLVSFYFRDEVLPYFAGGTPEARRYGAHDFMYYDLMCRAGRAGIRSFDFGRSKRDTGPFAFKKNWGFAPEPLAYEFHLRKGSSVPENNPLNPKYRLFIAAWKKLPLPLANRIGPHIVRHLG